MSSTTNVLAPYRVGILGGTFDPIHYGHIKPALDIAKQLKLDELSLMPAHIPPHKQGTHADAMHRLKMTELAAKEGASITVDNRELTRNTPSYTVDTLAQIRQERPNVQLFFLVGMDSLLSFTRWYKWQEILTYCHLVVSVRPGYDKALLNEQDQQALAPYFCDSTESLVHHHAGKIVLLNQPSIDVSSTELRSAITNNCFDESLQPKSVIDYIKRHNLYR
ncbi:nicotinate-nucleotide adenylyltransferase [Thalassotalea marina]|uniref:Probable nicotinate-nucleotide adenylyltransferase n=1 Tax=Thalassotalea marina TaxID=1673741 RepID=A0A919BBS9_9GAMM|nr:nicotinate-nucleotide adenylyltransferase [Thalassotalea marina]GHF81308.1 putative nicotinate-nucleotide adenylyltransferase [Thalassotalea marina]